MKHFILVVFLALFSFNAVAAEQCAPTCDMGCRYEQAKRKADKLLQKMEVAKQSAATSIKELQTKLLEKTLHVKSLKSSLAVANKKIEDLESSVRGMTAKILQQDDEIKVLKVQVDAQAAAVKDAQLAKEATVTGTSATIAELQLERAVLIESLTNLIKQVEAK